MQCISGVNSWEKNAPSCVKEYLCHNEGRLFSSIVSCESKERMTVGVTYVRLCVQLIFYRKKVEQVRHLRGCLGFPFPLNNYISICSSLFLTLVGV